MSQILYMWGPVPDLCGKGPLGGAAPPAGDDPVVLQGRDQAATQGSTGGLCGRVLWGVVDPPSIPRKSGGPLNSSPLFQKSASKIRICMCILAFYESIRIHIKSRGTFGVPKKPLGSAHCNRA